MNPQAEDRAAGEDDRKPYALALRLLARREHSVLELRNKLTGRRFDPDSINAVLSELLGQGLLSDRRFADVYVRSRYQRGYGPLRIRAELCQRGVTDEVLEASLAEWSRCWVAMADRQRSKRFGGGFPEDYRDRARQMRFLQQRGFTGEQIRAVFEASHEGADRDDRSEYAL